MELAPFDAAVALRAEITKLEYKLRHLKTHLRRVEQPSRLPPSDGTVSDRIHVLFLRDPSAVFSLQDLINDLGLATNQVEAVKKALQRLRRDGVVENASHGLWMLGAEARRRYGWDDTF